MWNARDRNLDGKAIGIKTYLKHFAAFFFSVITVDVIQLIYNLWKDLHKTHLLPTTLMDYLTSLQQLAR